MHSLSPLYYYVLAPCHNTLYDLSDNLRICTRNSPRRLRVPPRGTCTHAYEPRISIPLCVLPYTVQSCRLALGPTPDSPDNGRRRSKPGSKSCARSPATPPLWPHTIGTQRASPQSTEAGLPIYPVHHRRACTHTHHTAINGGSSSSSLYQRVPVAREFKYVNNARKNFRPAAAASRAPTTATTLRRRGGRQFSDALDARSACKRLSASHAFAKRGTEGRSYRSERNRTRRINEALRETARRPFALTVRTAAHGRDHAMNARA